MASTEQDKALQKILRNVDIYIKELEASIHQGTMNFEAKVRPEIMARTPLDSGSLRDSYSFGKMPDYTLESMHYAFSFGAGLVGDKGTPYAGEVHEWPAEVNWSTPNTGPKFLENPVKEKIAVWSYEIKKEVKKIKKL